VRSISPIPLSIIGLLMAALAGNFARAEVRVQGSVENVRLEASDATAAEILVALGERFKLRFRGRTANLRVTGTYEGPLRRILARVLDGYDYVVEPHAANIDVIVLNTGTPRHARPAPPPPPIVRRRVD
jgi:hypothetical protein